MMGGKGRWYSAVKKGVASGQGGGNAQVAYWGRGGGTIGLSAGH